VSRPTVVSVGDLHLDPVGRRVWRGEQEVVLTAQEFSLLQTLARRPGQVLSRQQLTHLAWDIAREEHSNIVDVCVRGLRNRVDRPFGRHSVQTVRGVGYRLSADDL
jgi:two-component system, OmpR family, response regulator